jgi:hypothetical protein
MRHKQQGFAILGLTVLVTTIALTFVLAQSALSARSAANSEDAEHARYLLSAKEKIEAWYRRNVAEVDSVHGVANHFARLFAESGIVPRWGVRYAVSEPIASGTLSYRTIAIWLPQSAADPSALDPATGRFVSGPRTKFQIVDGRAIEAEAFAATLAVMRGFARALEARFYAKRTSDSDRLIDANYFRPRDPACAAQADEIPCIAGYEKAAELNWRVILGLEPATLVSAWGSPILVSNTLDSQTSIPPFSMALQVATPWGATIRLAAVQPID